MAINNINTNYNTGIGQSGQTGQNIPVTGQQTGQGVVISSGNIDLSTGQTFSGQVINVDGKEIKLQLDNGQTINASLEGNIKATLGQILSLEVTANADGKMSLRPLYTNLNNSSTIKNALFNASLPNTENYARMVDSMMTQGLPINKSALNSMAQRINTFPNAQPETVVELAKLGVPINEVTINQYENYKGLEHQIINDVMNLADGLTELLDDSLEEARALLDSGAEILETAENPEQAAQAPMSKLLNAFLNAINGNENNAEGVAEGISKEAAESAGEISETAEALEEAAPEKKQIDAKSFDTARQIINLVDSDNLDDTPISKNLSNLLNELTDEIMPEKAAENPEEKAEVLEKAAEQQKTSDNPDNKVDNQSAQQENNTAAHIENKTLEADVRSLFTTVKNVLNTLENNPEAVPNKVRERLTELLSDRDFSRTLKETVSKQMLLKPEDVTSSKNIEELYSRITRQANQALEVLSQSGKDNPALMKSAANINDNVNFMNQLNQAVTYVQIPLLMNNKSAHGDLYVYTKKKNLEENDGNVSALLHLDMDNLGPMDVYVSLTNFTKVNTHFYLQDDATIDFIEQHIDLLNERLTKKGYETNMQVSVKDNSKGPTKMTDEFMKNDPDDVGMNVSKFSFDVRA